MVLGSLVRSTLDALTAPHGVDAYLGTLSPRLATREVRATVADVHHQTDDTVTLRLRPNAAWRGFRAGQHVQLSVAVDGVWHTRCFSPAGSEHATDGIELTVKANPTGVVSRHLRDARRGDVVRLSQAAGEFVLPRPRPAHGVLLVSGGSGITPVLAMLRTLCDEGYDRPVTLLHYSYGPADRLYRPELAELAAAHRNVEVVHAFTEHPGGDLTGLVCRDHLDAVAPDRARRATFLCGPPGLMAAVEALYDADGLTLAKERFTLAPAPAAERAGTGGTVAFTASGVEVADSGATLLEQAEAAGLSPLSGCRMGICHTCTRRLDAGEVRDVRTGACTTAVPGGVEVQLCVHTPVGDVAVDL